MSDYARRTKLKITFSGADITDDIMPYLLQLTYTDNEEDAADDLQIKLQDREGTWLTQWLNDMIEAATTVASDTATASTTTSTTPKVGDTVQFLGGKHYVSSDASKAASTGLKAGPAKLTIIKEGAKHPYHVIHTDSQSRVYGWVDSSSIEVKSSSGSSSSTKTTSLSAKPTATEENAGIQTLASSSGSSSGSSSSGYSVGDTVQFKGGKHYVSSDASKAASTGLKAGPAKLTIIKSGAKHPYHVIHTDSQTKVYGWVDSDEIEPLNASSSDASTGVDLSKTGFKIKAKITQKYWEDSDLSLSTGEFELDSVTETGPPSELTIKATSLPFSSKIRQTKETKAWEAYYLKSIAAEMAADNGMKSSYEASNNPYYSRVEQYRQSDIDFLSTLCHNAGLSLKATNNTIVIFDQATYEGKSAVRTINKGDGTYISYSLKNGQADVEYNSCRVSYTTSSGKCISATAYLSDYDAESETNQQLEITAKVSSTSEAKELAAKMLRLYNKYENTATFTLPGDTTLVAGVTVQLKKFGLWNGKYIVKSAKHTISHSGYQTQLTLRKVLEGY